MDLWTILLATKMISVIQKYAHWMLHAKINDSIEVTSTRDEMTYNNVHESF
jgi:hypothetical protein